MRQKFLDVDCGRRLEYTMPHNKQPAHNTIIKFLYLKKIKNKLLIKVIVKTNEATYEFDITI